MMMDRILPELLNADMCARAYQARISHLRQLVELWC